MLSVAKHLVVKENQILQLFRHRRRLLQNDKRKTLAMQLYVFLNLDAKAFKIKSKASSIWKLAVFKMRS